MRTSRKTDSCRQTLENDLLILAAACNHKVLKDNGSDLEEMITKTQRFHM